MNENSIDSLYRVLFIINEKEIKLYKLKNKRDNRLAATSLVSGFSLACLSILLFIVNKFYFQSDVVKLISNLILLLSYITFFLQPFVMMWFNRGVIIKVFTNPLSIFLDNSKATAYNDLFAISRLSSKPVENLRFLKLELEAERTSLEKRVSLISGAIEKVGLIPGLLALIVTIGKLGGEQPSWVYGVAYSIPIFYFISTAIHMQVSKLERMEALVEEAIERSTKES